MNQGNEATFRFYAELNDFLPPDRQRVSFSHPFNGKPAVKDTIEALGVPHTEVDLILVNGISVGFDYHLQNGDRVAVYPVFESLDITPIVKLRETPLRRTAFILDVHLGKLARLLRMLGFDTLYRNDYEDPEIIEIALRDHRIILTRDLGILKQRAVTHGYYIRSKRPLEQAREVIHRFDLADQVTPFARCMACNGPLVEVAKECVRARIPAKTARYYDRFYTCPTCDKVYWRGSHYERMKEKIARILR
jgi:hypothetical protein